MTVNVNVIVVCGYAGCPWSMEIDRSSGADPMAVHQAYLDHLDEHDPPDEAECEAVDRWLDVTHARIDECPSCHAAAGHPCTEYCRIARHDAEVARALLEDRIPAPHLPGGLYAGDTPEQIAAEQARIDRFMAGGNDA